MSDSKDDADRRPARPKRDGPGDERPQRSGRSGSGDRSSQRSSSDRDAKRPYGDRDAQRSGSDRDAKRPYGDRDAKRPPYGDRDAKRPYGDRDAKRPPYGDRDAKRPPYGDRDAKRPNGDRDARRPYGGDRRADDRGGRPGSRDADRDQPRETHGSPNLAVRPRHDDPEISERIQARDLDKGARAELKTLSKDNADWVARHLVAASEALEDDPELAHRHAMSAARRAGRIGVVRETLAITAYATGDFALALREFRTYRRISGSNEQLPLMVDSERGVGRPDRALEVGRSVDRATLPPTVQVGLAIAMSGARLDLGQPELALAELEIPQLDPDRAFSYSPALFSAYAEVLQELGRTAEAADWRARADRAEAALGGPAESELVEIFDAQVEDDDETRSAPTVEPGREAASAAPEAPEAPKAPEAAEAPEAPEAAQAPEAPEADDPGAVLEPEVAAVIAEGEALERDSGAAVDTDQADAIDEDGADGSVRHED